MDNTKNTSGKPKTIATYVRLKKDEHERIQNAAVAQGMSIPELMKHVVLKGPLPIPLMFPDEHRVISTELNRIGNNMNQIAKKLNSGFREGFNNEFENMQREFNKLWAFLMGRPQLHKGN